MDVIVDTKVLQRRLLHEVFPYDHLAFATACASAGTKVLGAIVAHNDRIEHGVTGATPIGRTPM